MRFLLFALFGAWLLCTTYASQGGTLGVSVRPLEEQFQLGEPVRLELLFSNQGAKEVVLDLGTSDVSALSVVLTPAGGGQVLAGAGRDGEEKGGLQMPIVIRIAPGSSYRHVFLLNKLVTPERAGRYKLAVEVGGTGLPPVSTELVLSPRREGLADDLKRWLDLAEGAGAGGDERLRAVEYIVYTRAREALPYQEKILGNALLRTEQVGVLIRNMLAADQHAAAGTLTRRLADAGGDKSLRQALLFALKSYGLGRLDGASAKLLEPFRKEIESAAPLVISN